VSVWCNKFKDGRKALNDDPQKNTGRPRTSHTDENSVIVESLIKEDQRAKIREISEVTGIAKSTVHEIISCLNFRKVSARWVPKTEGHKSKRMAASLENLYRYQDEGETFVESIVTGDETWVYEFTPESIRYSVT
jgi:outer membrane protein assembly factor BamA